MPHNARHLLVWEHYKSTAQRPITNQKEKEKNNGSHGVLCRASRKLGVWAKLTCRPLSSHRTRDKAGRKTGRAEHMLHAPPLIRPRYEVPMQQIRQSTRRSGNLADLRRTAQRAMPCMPRRISRPGRQRIFSLSGVFRGRNDIHAGLEVLAITGRESGRGTRSVPVRDPTVLALDELSLAGGLCGWRVQLEDGCQEAVEREEGGRWQREDMMINLKMCDKYSNKRVLMIFYQPDAKSWPIDIHDLHP
jgi:hypothetical protein